MRIAFVLTLASSLCLGSLRGAEDFSPAQAAKDRNVVETLLRLPGADVNSSPKWKAATIRYLETVKATPKYVELVEKLKLRGVEDELLRLALDDPASTHGAKAAALLARAGELPRLAQAAAVTDEPQSLKAVAALGNVGDDAAMAMLKPLLLQPGRSSAFRVAAARSLGRNLHGQKFLLELAEMGKLPPDAKFTAADILLSSGDPAIRTAAGSYLTLPAGANSKPLPPIAELLKMQGDAASGSKLYFGTATCSKCHQIRSQGKQVGPDLSEIGSKLTRDALYVSILDPNAGISHNYETYTAVTSGGQIVTGILVSRTDQSVTLRTSDAIDREMLAKEIDELHKGATSLMPADLQKVLSLQELVDLVEFLATLKKPT